MPAQFPGMMPMQFAQSPALGTQLAGLGTALKGLAPKPGAAPVPTAGAPMDISPAATNAGTNVPQPGLMDALKGMSPQSILGALRQMSAGPQPGLPGSAALQGAGMISPLGVPTPVSRGVADLVSNPEAAEQARRAAAARISQGVLGRGTATANDPMLPILPAYGD